MICTGQMTVPQVVPQAAVGFMGPHAEARTDVGRLTEPVPETDPRIQNLLGTPAWESLPVAVRRRFSKCFKPAEALLYSGHVVETRLSLAGRAVSALARLIGSPLPGPDGNMGAAAVSVIEDQASRHQNWTRTYERPGRFPQVVHSMKRFSGPTGLEEYVGSGIGMTLNVSVEDGALVFRSGHYFFEWGRFRLRVPRALSPGDMEIVHRDEPGYEPLDNAFSFRLTLTHPMLGPLVHQLAYFREVGAAKRRTDPR